MTILAVGDVYVTQPERVVVFDYVAPLFRSADAVFGNQEGAICGGGEPLSGKSQLGGTHNPPCKPEAARVLKEAGITAVSVANNCTMDYGVKGLLETLESLDQAGVGHAGGGSNRTEAHRAVCLERNGVRIAFLAYTSAYVPILSPAGDKQPGLAAVEIATAYEVPFNISYCPGVSPRVITMAKAPDRERALNDIRKAKSSNDVVVVSWHWGMVRKHSALAMAVPEEAAPFYTLNYQEDLGRAAIDAGADIVFGHHAHELQGVEMYKGKVICYGMGNFGYDRKKGYFGGDSAILKCSVVRKTAKRFSLYPVSINENNQPKCLGNKKLTDSVALYERLSRKYGTQFIPDGKELIIAGPEEG
ncbi:MAG: CapA family protein [Chloroflexi bacterium]|nr:CapA family protein [Chloroflexota bacterium]